ncbi:MAG: HAD family hydrolase [Candidatus Marsarchaeota archaeon]|nr:HAD family hydrolase [Candidatus Marsarchaeota archaeon]
MLKWVVFDFGDTLSDDNFLRRKLSENKERSRILKKFGVNASEEKIRRVIEEKRHRMWGKMERHRINSLELIAKEKGVNLTAKQLARLVKLYEQAHLKYSKPVQNASELLNFITGKNLRLALISNTTPERLSKRLLKLGFKNKFKIIITSVQVGGEKSSLFPFMVFLARANKFIETKPEEVLMVGDRVDEDIAASILGIRTVLFDGRTKGFKKMKGVQPEFKIKDLLELKKIINELA